MVIVDIKRNNGTILKVEIAGHAGYEQVGKDLVCAGVSSIAIGILNALDRLSPNTCKLNMQEAYICIEVKQFNPIVDTVLSTMVIQLLTMQESYSEYIQITDQEV